MKWITRSNVKVDRVACPWLIRRFVDPQAQFLFAPEEELLEAARTEDAIPFDATRFPEVKLNHRAERCTFEAILEDFRITDPALHRLALIVRRADVQGQEHVFTRKYRLACYRSGLRPHWNKRPRTPGERVPAVRRVVRVRSSAIELSAG